MTTSSSDTTSWHEANQQALMEQLLRVRSLIHEHVTRLRDVEVLSKSTQQSTPNHERISQGDIPFAFNQLRHGFALSDFELDVLLMCAGFELDSTFASLFTSIHDDGREAAPTFGLALAAFPDAHWSALSPSAPLRYWRLLEVGRGERLTHSTLRIDERILHYLIGLYHIDEHLRGFISSWELVDDELVPSHENIVTRIVEIWNGRHKGERFPVIMLPGGESAAKRSISRTACKMLGLNIMQLSAHALPVNPSDFATLVRLWEREALLSSSVLFVDCESHPTNDDMRKALLSEFIERVDGMLIVASRERMNLANRTSVAVEVRKATRDEQLAIWKQLFRNHASARNGQLEALSVQFDLNISDINTAFSRFNAVKTADDASDEHALWDTCRAQTRRSLQGLATCLDPVASLEDLVLPPLQKQTLHDIVMHARHRMTVYKDWGFEARSSRGLGIAALFSGPSGSGKTMAAEAIAKELRLDLYHIDLSLVVSKYIGETEKNLAKLFDAAETGGAVLLFDEADALFGKRGEVKDGIDRYANLEVSYLLQRMESYRGLAILTTNMKNAIDDAFHRRIRFFVSFPFPTAPLRAEIWRRIFPPETPTEQLDPEKLASLNVAGGTIRNIAIHAAFSAAEQSEPVRMTHILHAVRSMYSRLDKTLTDNETRGWA